MEDIDDITSIRSSDRIETNKIEDIDLGIDNNINNNQHDDINHDEPSPNLAPSRKLQELLKNVDKMAAGKNRLPLKSNRNVASVRVVPDFDDNDLHVGKNKNNNNDKSARNYMPMEYVNIPMTRVPNRNVTRTERAYVWRQKFQRLNAQNPKIEIPETNDPDALERMYYEAIRTNHYCSTSSTWLIYMGIGYAAFQLLLHKIGFTLPPQFVPIQLEVMASYPTLLKSLGEPGGPSLGSSWPPWIKLMFVIAMHSLIFIIIFKLTGSVDNAHNAQRFICRTGIMGGRPQSDEGQADNAMANVGGILGGLGGLFGGNGNGGGLQNMLGNVMSMFGGGGRSAMDDIDLESPPEPLSNRSTQSSSSQNSNTQRQFNSRRPTPFD